MNKCKHCNKEFKSHPSKQSKKKAEELYVVLVQFLKKMEDKN
jgi:hypothetical protein